MRDCGTEMQDCGIYPIAGLSNWVVIQMRDFRNAGLRKYSIVLMRDCSNPNPKFNPNLAELPSALTLTLGSRKNRTRNLVLT